MLFDLYETFSSSTLTPPVPIQDEEKKIKLNFFFSSLWCLKSFMMTLKALIKPFEAPQRSVKIKIQLNFYFNATSRHTREGKGYIFENHLLKTSDLSPSLHFLTHIYHECKFFVDYKSFFGKENYCSVCNKDTQRRWGNKIGPTSPHETSKIMKKMVAMLRQQVTSKMTRSL